jgi:hypothetical protein
LAFYRKRDGIIVIINGDATGSAVAFEVAEQELEWLVCNHGG